MFYIVGLGNPGDKYINTRHNVGRMVLEEMSDNSLIKDKPSNASIASMSLGGEVIQLFAPETFMNNSGETVKYIVSKLGAVTEDVIVVHDDIDLPFGEVKVAKGRGAGGNNGVESIIKQLKSKNFVRVRVGIAPKSFWTGKVKRPAGGGPLERFVLKPFASSERKDLPMVLAKAKEAIELVVSSGVEVAMNKIN